MKIDENCEIILDLLPNYVEGLLSNKSKLLIERHLKDCEKCKTALETIKKENEKDTYFLQNEKAKNINVLKKYNFRLNIFRIIFLIIIILLFFCGTIFIFHQYKGQSIINKVIAREQELLKIDNYCIRGKTIYIDHKNKEKRCMIDATYVKGDKYKNEFKLSPEVYYQDYKQMNGDQDFVRLEYGTFSSKERIWVFPNTKSARKEISENPDFIKEKSDFILSLKGTYLHLPTKYFRKEKYMGKECYVKRYGSDSAGYKEVWIDSETLFPVRTIEEQYGKYYRESTDEIQYGIVTDEDVNFNEEGYEIEQLQLPSVEDLLNNE